MCVNTFEHFDHLLCPYLFLIDHSLFGGVGETNAGTFGGPVSTPVSAASTPWREVHSPSGLRYFYHQGTSRTLLLLSLSLAC